MAEPLDRVTPPLTVVDRTPPSTSSSARRMVTRERLALLGILFIGAVLDVFRLDQEGYANTYYAAAVKSMLLSWHNFFFAAFDPGGFLAVDKPPLGLWVQVAGARLLGFNGVSLLVPQALAGVLSILLLYYLVARAFGSPAGLLAALALALTPIAVVDNRNNTSDSLLILTLLLAAWAVTRAVESGRLRWLLLGAVFVGLGFNIKELQAYLVLPALVLVYLLAAPRRWWVRLWHLIVAAVVLLVVSFSWIVAVDLTPASQRPYVTDSGTNSELSLALGYNGFGRLTAGLFSHLSVPFLHVKLDFSIVPGISTEIGSPGLLRLFSPAIAEQVSWLLPLALLGVAVAFARSRPYLPLRRAHVGLIVWGTWLLTAGVFFSVARFYHLYYLIMLAPAVAALAGIGLTVLWADYREGMRGGRRTWWKGWALPLTLLGTALIQAQVLSSFAGANGWPTWLAPAVIGVCVVVAAALVAIRLRLRFLLSPDLLLSPGPRVAMLAAGIGIASLLAAPAAWASASVADGNGAAWLPQAGPSQGFGGGFAPSRAGFAGRFRGGPPRGRSFTPPANGSFRGGFPGAGRSGTGGFPGAGTPGARRFGRGSFRGGFGAITFAGSDIPKLDPKLLSYLETHRGTARYLVATMTTSYASLIILDTGQPVMALGGYQGWDKILTTTQLAHLVANGTIRNFLISGSGGGGAGFPGRFGGARFGNATPSVDQNLNTVNNDLMIWIQSHCSAVPTGKYQTTSSGNSTAGNFSRGFGSSGSGTLYACTVR